MWHSIQQTLRNINSRISVWNILSLLVAAIILLGLAMYIDLQEKAKELPVLYIPSSTTTPITRTDSRPFGSINGTTYTFSWCQGASQIKYKVYFDSEAAAISSGRRLSKLCQ